MLMGHGGSADVCIGQNTSISTDQMLVTLKRIQEDPDPATQSSPYKSPKRKDLIENAGSCTSDDELRFSRNLRHRPSWIRYQEFESSSEDESGCAELNKNNVSPSLPVKSQKKAAARWKPEAACRPMLEEAPVYFPLEEEFKDTLKYIASIRAEAEQYGICRIVPPHAWRPPCPLKDSQKRQTARFSTRVQQVEKLQVREAHVKKSKRKRRRCRSPRRSERARDNSKDFVCDSSSEDDCKFGFEPGPKLTLESFEKHAHQFKEEYFWGKEQSGNCSNHIPNLEPSVESIEGEYWRIVEQGTEEVEVLYGADIETHEFGSGFVKPKPGVDPTPYESTGWNLNNIARLPGSILAFEEEDISGVLLPWLYVGMCFSSFCWHVEDHYFYSLNYMHFGCPKVWYGVPGNAASIFEDAMKKHLPDLFEEQPDLLHKLVTQLSPSILRASGVPIYKAVQRAGEFVVTFPRAYHAGFNCGFNCAEAVNVAPVNWLPYGQTAVEMYKEARRKSSVSHDKLLLGAAQHAVRSLYQDLSLWGDQLDQEGVLLKVLKNRVGLERTRRGNIASFVHVRKMDKDFDAADARECLVCLYDLHLSAVGCECSPERYTCLEHAHELCACGQARKYALYRHAISELDNIVNALECSPEGMNIVKQALELGSPKQSCSSHAPTSSQSAALEFVSAGCNPSLQPIKTRNLLWELHNFLPNECKPDVDVKRCSEVIVVSDDDEHVADSICSSNTKEKLEAFYMLGKPVYSRALEDKGNELAASLPHNILWEAENRDWFSLSSSVSKPLRNGSGKEPSSVARCLTFAKPEHSLPQELHYKVDLLNLGHLVLRKSWSNQYTIFTAGFRSRVAFPSLLDPMKLCFYISEVLEGGQGDPLFKVSMEDHLGEVFMNSCIDKCWQMVQERVNITIRLWYSNGDLVLNPPEAIQGLELFGFTSPHILKAVESLDWQYQCLDYWAEKVPAFESASNHQEARNRFGGDYVRDFF